MEHVRNPCSHYSITDSKHNKMKQLWDFNTGTKQIQVLSVDSMITLYHVNSVYFSLLDTICVLNIFYVLELNVCFWCVQMKQK